MLRMETEDGWWLIPHPDHAGLAHDFALHWGNAAFARPEPRESVLHGIKVHDDGWAKRDARPGVTRQGKPAAFSKELVGKYSAFEEIDLADYLAVRESAVALVEERDAYAALLVSMHTHNLLTERADRSTIAVEQLPLLDAFLERQRARQERLREEIRASGRYAADVSTDAAVLDNFRLLQAMDNLSLLSCVAYREPATLLHAFPMAGGATTEIRVEAIGERRFRLAPYPFDVPEFTCTIAARHVAGKVFGSSKELAERFAAAPVERLSVVISA
jgi:hypothetical protein